MDCANLKQLAKLEFDVCGIMVLKGCDGVRGDCHVHMILDGIDWKVAIGRHADGVDMEFVRCVLGKYRDLGYTYLRDGGDRWGAGAAARDLAPEYGIQYKTPLAPLCKVGHYGAFIGETFRDMQDFARLVQLRRRQGADFIKIMISGLMDFDHYGVLTQEGLADDEISEMIHIAKGEGFGVMAHANGARVIAAAAAAGVDSVEHGAYPDEDALCAMAENGTVWVPTVSTVGNLLGKGRFDEKNVRSIFDRTMENIRLFHHMGGLIAPGTDAGAWAVPHGCATEEAYLRRAGVDDKAQQQAILKIMDKF